MDKQPNLILLRQDLRLQDNPALWHAAEAGAPLIVLYILDDETPGKWKMGAAQRWWLHYSLKALSEQLKTYKVPLILRRGSTEKILQEIVKKHHVQSIYYNRCYEPYWIALEKKLAHQFCVNSYNSALLIEPWDIVSRQGTPFKVFTPFWNALSKDLHVEKPLPAPRHLQPFAAVSSDNLDDWQLLPTHPDWAKEFSTLWQPGEKGAHEKLNDFANKVSTYDEQRNVPSEPGTSMLSPHLQLGEIGPRQIYHHIRTVKKAEDYIRELGWRDFAHSMLYYFPHLAESPFQEKFARFAWKQNNDFLKAWQKGLTGFPIVDAGMRQLWRVGWMHNRVRMIVGSFLTKNLLVPWQEGESWFWDTLVDASLANNAFNWQWIAGCGADAAPFFRIFNPTLQGEKFDPEGEYIKKWVPELSSVPSKYVHEPWKAPLLNTGNYPSPLVDLRETRERALELFAQIK